MNTEIIAIISGGILGLAGILVTYVTSIDKKRISTLEKAISNLANAIEGYHRIEEAMAKKLGKDVSIYRREIRENYDVKNFNFPTPSDVKDYKKIIGN